MYNKIKPLDLNHVSLVMKELANFHGMWLRYKFAAKKGKYSVDAVTSMTQLLTHSVAHSTKPSFRPKTNNQPLKKFFSLALN